MTRIGLDAGNYGYVLTLDGIHDEDVREIYAYGAKEIEGDVLIDARENAKITLIDLAGDTYSTGGIDGDSNIFVTYDDELEILGGENDDDVDVILDGDIEDGEFQFDGGGDDEDTLVRSIPGILAVIDRVEYVDIDAPDGTKPTSSSSAMAVTRPISGRSISVTRRSAGRPPSSGWPAPGVVNRAMIRRRMSPSGLWHSS